MTADDLEAVFTPRGERRGGVLFLDVATALELVAAARRAGVRVLGVDGFRLSATVTQPLMEFSLDLTRSPTRSAADPWGTVENFLRPHRGTDLRFEVVLEVP